MAGGLFITQNKIRPGFYHKFVAAQKAKNLFADTGIAALPLSLDWGPAGEMIVLDVDASEQTCLKKIGKTRNEILPVGEVFKHAKTLITYRLNGDGVKASLDMTPQPVIATANYSGIQGNEIRIAIEEETVGGSTYVAKTYVGAILRDEQTNIKQAEDLKNNDWIVFSGTGAITAAAGGSLIGGTNGTPSLSDYAQFLMLLESYDCNAFGTMSVDADVQELFIQSANKRMNELGRLGQCVLCDVNSDSEAIISVKNGVILRDGRTIDKQMAVAWVIGAAAAAGPAKSLTYTAYDGAIASDVRLSGDAIKQALSGGGLIFTAQRNEYGDEIAVIEQDINTLLSFTEERPEIWRKNRVVRSLHYLVNSLSRIWHLYYVGKVDNNSIGRSLFKADIVTLMRTLVELGAFENFDSETDIIVEKGSVSDAVIATMAVQPVDAMEKIYFTIEVK